MKLRFRKKNLSKGGYQHPSSASTASSKTSISSSMHFVGDAFSLRSARRENNRFENKIRRELESSVISMPISNDSNNVSIMTLRKTVSDSYDEDAAFCMNENSVQVKISSKDLLSMADRGRIFKHATTKNDYGLWIKVTTMKRDCDSHHIENKNKAQSHQSYLYRSVFAVGAAAIFYSERVSVGRIVSSIVDFFLNLSVWSDLLLIAMITYVYGNGTRGFYDGNDVKVQTTTDLLIEVETKMVQKLPSSNEPSSPAYHEQTEPKRDVARRDDEPEVDYPVRYLRAAKGDPVHGRVRYEQTMKWRKENDMDKVVDEPFVYYNLIKKNYPQYFHLRGHNNEPVYYEKPAKVNLKALTGKGMKKEELLRYYMLVTEYMWTEIEPSEDGKNIYIIDLEGISALGLFGEKIDFVKDCASVTGAHYPERSATIFVINVPGWFNLIWKAISPFVDPVTKEKVRILKGKTNILNDFLTRIPMENIPPEYGGQSMPLGQSPEEEQFRRHMEENVRKAGLTMR